MIFQTCLHTHSKYHSSYFLSQGLMTVYLGGQKDVCDSAMYTVKHYTATQLYLGGYSSPATVKIVSNMLCAANTALIGEAMTIFKYV